jgi:hypothetical protein
MAVYASGGKSQIAARIHTCLGAARFAPAETADFILEWIKLRKDVARSKDIAESNAAGFVLNYIKHDCSSPSADYARPAKPLVSYKEFAALTPPLQASYVEAIQDTLEAFTGPGESAISKRRECMTVGLMDVQWLVSAVTEYAKLTESRIEPDASFAEVTLFYLATRCK